MLKKIVTATLNSFSVIAPEEVSNALESQKKKAEKEEEASNDDKTQSN